MRHHIWHSGYQFQPITTISRIRTGPFFTEVSLSPCQRRGLQSDAVTPLRPTHSLSLAPYGGLGGCAWQLDWPGFTSGSPIFSCQGTSGKFIPSLYIGNFLGNSQPRNSVVYKMFTFCGTRGILFYFITGHFLPLVRKIFRYFQFFTFSFAMV